MNLLVINFLHNKNKNALIKYKNINITWSDDFCLVDKFNYIYSPTLPINQDLYKDKNFIFGPHFSVFPDSKVNQLGHNSIYIQPSIWVCNSWNMNNNKLKIYDCPFGVDTDRFCENNYERDKVFIYFKRRNPQELEYLKEFLSKKCLNYRIFNYEQSYNEGEYLDYLQKSKYGIILDAHESQGFAIEEALSCNVPLLVWNIRYMSQEFKSNYGEIPATSIPYWDERCGEYFYEKDELESIFNKFISNIERKEYKPREYVLENLSMEVCEKRFMKLFTLNNKD